MGRAADPSLRGLQLPVSHDPLRRLNYSTPKPIPDLGEVLAQVTEFLQTFLLQAIEDLTGLDLSSPDAFWESIVAIVTQTFTGAEGDLTQLEEWAHTVEQNAEDALNQLAALIDMALGTGHSVEDFVLWLENFLTPNSALNASNLWGLLGPGVSLKVPSTSVTAEQAQPLWNPNFEGAVSLNQIGGWSWDSTVYFELSTTMSGSAAITADGAVHALRSNPISVDSGQMLTPTAYVLTSGLVCTGSPIQLDVIEYLGDAQVAVVPLVAMGAPTGPTTGWTNPPSGSKAGTMSATYTVPDDDTVDNVKLRIVLDSTATAGTVRFGAVPTVIAGGLIADLQSDLTTIQEDETAKAAATATLWQDIGTAISTYGLTDWEAMAVAINAAYQTWNTIVTGIDASEDETILNMLSELLGIDLATGQNSQWAAVMAQITALQTLLASPPVSTSSWATWWHDTLVALGVDSTDATNTANFLSGNYDAAKTAKANWDAMLTALGLTPTQVASAISTATTNWTTFMAAWGVGTPADVAAATAASQAKWNAFLASIGLGSATAAGAQLATNNTTIGSHTTAIGTNTTNISNTWSWLFGTTTPTSSNQVVAGAVPAVGNQQNLLQAVQAGWDQLVQAFTGTTDTGHSLGQLANAASGTATTAGNALTTAQSATMVQAQQATAKPGYMAIDATMDAVFPVSHMLVAPTYISVTAATAVLGYISIPDNVSKLSVAFVGSYTGTISALYINVYSMNPTTGVLTNVVASTNIIGSVGNLSQWNYYALTADLACTVGDWFAVEMVIAGTGTYSLMGVPSTAIPLNGTVFPQALGASRSMAPSHDTTGAGSSPSGATTTFTWSHTIGVTATAILIQFGAFVNSGTLTVSSVKVGTTSATLVASKAFSVGASGSGYVYRLLNPPTGTQTITVIFGSSTFFAGNSDSYNGVTSIGTAATNSGASSGTASVAVSSAVGQTAVAAIFAVTSVSAFNQTSRWTAAGGSGISGVFGDAAGASTVSFSATAGGAWAAIGVSLVGISAASPPASIASPAYSTNVPWFGMGTTAIAATPVFAPESASYTNTGSHTYTLPTWFKSGVDFLDVIAVGPGGGGGGGAGAPGSTGSATTVTVGGTTVTAAAGAGGIAGNCPQSSNYGASPGNQIYNGTTYYGGSSSAFGYGLVTAGSSPGGGGAGGGTGGVYAFGGSAGHWATQTFNPTGTTVSVTVTAGGAANPSFLAEDGAAGAVWLVARQA